MKKYALIVAGGSGTRMGSATPKQFLELGGKPVLRHTLDSFLNAFPDLEIILATAKNHYPLAQKIVDDTGEAERIVLAEGGPTRFHSVRSGLQQISGEAIVFVHDAVRCLLSTDLIHRCYKHALEHGNAIPATHAVDSIRMQTDEGSVLVDRRKIRIVQTPQTFYNQTLQIAFKQEYDESFTDEATVVERCGTKIHLIEGESTNIKITQPIDLLIAENILREKNGAT